MLFLLFHLGSDRYAIDARQVVEVLPLVEVKQIPHAPAGMAGIFNYHGDPVPLMDLAELALGRSSRMWMSTRILLVKYALEPGEMRLLGLLAERATETLRRTEEDFTDPGVAVPEASYLGQVTTDAIGIIQKIEIRHLFHDHIRNHLSAGRIGLE
jgi:chemotaxis-related protein WspB